MSATLKVQRKPSVQPVPSSAERLVKVVRSRSDEHIADEIRARRSMSNDERVEREKTQRRSRAEAAAARLRAS
ncbi:hypothetical protein [Labedella gwakjiensis]|uniref:Uncharacterized protein n=1 Tax=Labedella gwakjiensis TaxID=390269 RepID=A0ABY0C7D8_9MICO|nr:hypothetical protein [Labedella gwakjiensis]RUQ85970.1 hypothetical protein ELQ93_02835 [Labedella gwakjiensis]